MAAIESLAVLTERRLLVSCDRHGWPTGAFSYRASDGVVHAVKRWWNDSMEEMFTWCGWWLKDDPDDVLQAPTCLRCVAASEQF